MCGDLRNFFLGGIRRRETQKRMRRRLGEVLRAAVVPIPVRGSVVRVDVAETIVGTVVQMAATADGANHVQVHEVGSECTSNPDFFF